MIFPSDGPIAFGTPEAKTFSAAPSKALTGLSAPSVALPVSSAASEALPVSLPPLSDPPTVFVFSSEAPRSPSIVPAALYGLLLEL